MGILWIKCSDLKQARSYGTGLPTEENTRAQRPRLVRPFPWGVPEESVAGLVAFVRPVRRLLTSIGRLEVGPVESLSKEIALTDQERPIRSRRPAPKLSLLLPVEVSPGRTYKERAPSVRFESQGAEETKRQKRLDQPGGAA